MEATAVIADWTVRVAVVGSSGVGKTTLIEAFVGEPLQKKVQPPQLLLDFLRGDASRVLHIVARPQQCCHCCCCSHFLCERLLLRMRVLRRAAVRVDVFDVPGDACDTAEGFEQRLAGDAALAAADALVVCYTPEDAASLEAARAVLALAAAAKEDAAAAASASLRAVLCACKCGARALAQTPAASSQAAVVAAGRALARERGIPHVATNAAAAEKLGVDQCFTAAAQQALAGIHSNSHHYSSSDSSPCRLFFCCC